MWASYFMSRLQVAFFGTTSTCKYLYSKHNFLVPTANYANLPKRVLACFKKLPRSAEEQTDIVKERQMAVQVSALMTLFDMMTRIKWWGHIDAASDVISHVNSFHWIFIDRLWLIDIRYTEWFVSSSVFVKTLTAVVLLRNLKSLLSVVSSVLFTMYGVIISSIWTMQPVFFGCFGIYIREF